MTDLGFDIYAMVEPKSRADASVMLNEALDELARVNEALGDLLDSPAGKP